MSGNKRTINGKGESRSRPLFVKDRNLRTSIIKCLKLGMSINTTAKIVGINANNLRKWINRGNEVHVKPTYYQYQINDEAYEQFFLDVQEASRDGILRRVARIDKHANKDWKADKWLLECQHADLFGRPSTELFEKMELQISTDLSDYDAQNADLELDDVIQLADKMGVPLPVVKEHIDE